MVDVKIYRPAKTAMQSARSKSRQWKVEFMPTCAKKANAVVGWIGSSDTKAQLNELFFDTLDQAIEYADKNQLKYRVFQPKDPKMLPKAYADNFSYTRKESWTH